MQRKEKASGMTGGAHRAEMGSSVLDPYTGKINPRTDLKVGHYKAKLTKSR
jgi:hypothetical protein